MHRVRLPAPAVDQVLVGGFTEDDRYDVWRPAGTEDWLLLNTLEGAGRPPHVVAIVFGESPDQHLVDGGGG